MAELPGKRLQAARTALGLTPEDVSRATRMRTLQIVALEKDDYSVFSGNSYARSFLQMYAKFLKVDVSEAMDDMPMPGKIAIENYQYLNNRDEDPAYRPTGRQSRPSSRPQNGGGNTGKWLLAVVIIVPALIFAITLIVNLHRLGLGASHDLEADSAALVEATPEATITPSPTPTPTPVPTVAPPPIPTTTPETVSGTSFGLSPGVTITLPASPSRTVGTPQPTP